jgi:biopolymer transport protein TolR
LPSVGKSLAPPVAPMEIIIRKDTTLALRDHAKGGQESPVSRDELVNRLQKSIKKNSEQPVVISADKSVRYEEVVNIMDMLQQQNIKKIGLLTKTR